MNVNPKDIDVLVDIHPDQPAMRFLLDIGNEIVNTRKMGKSWRWKNTYMLSQYASSSFLFDVIDGHPFLAVPAELYPRFLDMNWSSIRIINGMSGIFLLFTYNMEADAKIYAVRINMRPARVEVLSKHRMIHVIGHVQGQTQKINKASMTYRTLPVFVMDEPTWEPEWNK
ncbi:hypothetical protein [Neptuniibacter sp. QD37_11]|uniref:hypothetical protein n=1 Tax=Neptuniibacter sp. QD37_11 TaxID=3398209 RepID=UPI0039F5ED1D